MPHPFFSREQVAEQFSISTRVLIRYEASGLVRSVRSGTIEGYGPAEIRRLLTIVSCQRDLGINLAGVEAVLKLRDHLAQVHDQLDLLAGQMRLALDNQTPDDPNA